MNILEKTTKLAMHLTIPYIEEGDSVVDATAGNGRDTLELAKAVGTNGKVLAIDIQEQALSSTKKLLQENNLTNVEYIQDNFINIDKYAENQGISAVVFNLGYLPTGDKTITTITEDTLLAVEKALRLIKIGGIITITMYSGHAEGAKEHDALLKWSKNLRPSTYHAVYFSMHNQGENAPEVLTITRKK